MKVTQDISSLCPVARALACVGDSWTLLILRDAMQGARRFDEFQRGLGIASSMLTRRLERMVFNELLEKRCYQQHPPRHEYHLTDKGHELAPVILMLYRWGEQHLPIEANGFRLIDRRTLRPVEPILYDRHHGRPLSPGDVRLAPGPDANPAVHARVERMRKAFERGDSSDSQPAAARADCHAAMEASDSIND
ncbi:MAG: helix-turn-helix transcriptional regulator [Salinicola sp.]|uniref:winged helix-turn-helix transcriptional regulator n=1 Tax=Salinicola sp. TaxID=1978524 RepID=UPI001DB08B99|nr:helix-turn-helix domain-containing protein [Salinicola sp.]NRB57535.1 helix-turn-helix transcriptional regulator [Salinicola sp.]